LLLESAVASRGAKLSASSLQCVPGSRSVCLVHGPIPGGEFGEVIVGRSGKWDATDKLYFSDAGYMALADIDGDNTADVVTAQQGFFAQVFAVNGTELGCTKTVAKLAQLPGWPTIKPTKAQLHDPC